jgi:hypothetical protein
MRTSPIVPVRYATLSVTQATPRPQRLAMASAHDRPILSEVVESTRSAAASQELRRPPRLMWRRSTLQNVQERVPGTPKYSADDQPRMRAAPPANSGARRFRLSEGSRRR